MLLQRSCCLRHANSPHPCSHPPTHPTPPPPPDEEPLSPELTIDARDEAGAMQSAEAMAGTILKFLEERGYLGRRKAGAASWDDEDAATA